MRAEIWNKCDINSKEIFTSGQIEIFWEKLSQTRGEKIWELKKVTKVHKEVNLEVKKRSFEKTAQMLSWKNWKESSSAKFFANLNKFIFERSLKGNLKDGVEWEAWHGSHQWKDLQLSWGGVLRSEGGGFGR